MDFGSLRDIIDNPTVELRYSSPISLPRCPTPLRHTSLCDPISLPRTARAMRGELVIPMLRQVLPLPPYVPGTELLYGSMACLSCRSVPWAISYARVWY
eukprot:3564658-Rhodomonas_salina.1